MGDYFDAARTAVARHGGRIEKFIGDAVMAVFGFPRANEDDALRAVRAAWDMRQLIDQANDELRRRWDVELAIRTGVATGNVVASDRTTGEPFVMGTSVNLAARLEQRAGTGEILLDGITRRIARNAIEAEEVTLEDLRGFEGSVSAFRLVRVLDTGQGLPRPEPPFVNRTAELRLLHETYESHLTSERCRTLTLNRQRRLGEVAADRRVPPGASARGRAPHALSRIRRRQCAPAADGRRGTGGRVDSGGRPGADRRADPGTPRRTPPGVPGRRRRRAGARPGVRHDHTGGDRVVDPDVPRDARPQESAGTRVRRRAVGGAGAPRRPRASGGMGARGADPAPLPGAPRAPQPSSRPGDGPRGPSRCSWSRSERRPAASSLAIC